MAGLGSILLFFGYTVFPVCGRWDVFQSKNRGRGLKQHYWKDTLHAGVLKVIRSLLPDSCSAVFSHELWTVLAQSGQGIVRSLHIAHSGTENTRFGSREAAAWVDCAWDRTRHAAHLPWDHAYAVLTSVLCDVIHSQWQLAGLRSFKPLSKSVRHLLCSCFYCHQVLFRLPRRAWKHLAKHLFLYL